MLRRPYLSAVVFSAAATAPRGEAGKAQIHIAAVGTQSAVGHGAVAVICVICAAGLEHLQKLVVLGVIRRKLDSPLCAVKSGNSVAEIHVRNGV